MPSAVPGQSHNWHCYPETMQEHQICPPNFSEYIRRGSCTGSRKLLLPLVPAELLFTVNIKVRQHFSEALSDKVHVLTDSFHFLHLKDGKYCRFYVVVFHFQNLAYQLSVLSKRKITSQSSNQWHTDIHSTAICTTGKGLLFMMFPSAHTQFLQESQGKK